jgi:hypothetical protein
MQSARESMRRRGVRDDAAVGKATRMQRTTRMVVASFVGASLMLLGAVASARAADEWYVLGA